MRKSFWLLQTKNCISIIKKGILSLLLIITLLAVAFAAVNFVMNKDNAYIPLKVAITLDKEDDISKLLLRYISNEETIEAVSEFIYVDEKEAFEGLLDGRYDVAIKLPEGFYDDINDGKNTPLNVYFAEDADRVTVAFVGLLISAESYVKNAEATVYSFLSIVSNGEYSVVERQCGIGDYLALIYARIFFKRLTIYDNIIVSPLGTIDFISYIYICVIALVLMYSITMFRDLLDGNSKDFDDTLVSYGVSKSFQVYVKQCIVFCYLMCLSIFAVLIGALLKAVDVDNVAPVICALVLYCMSLCSIYTLIMSIFRNGYKDLITLLLFVIMLIFCGLFVPYCFLPDSCEVIGSFFPLTYMCKSLTDAVLGSIELSTIAILIIFLVIEECLIFFVSKKA